MTVRCAVLALALVAVPAALAQSPADPARRTPVVVAVEKASPAVVNVSTTKLVEVRDPFFRMYEGTRPAESMGSGAIIHPDGYVVTNSHVVRMAVEDVLVSIEVDGAERQWKSIVLAEDPRNDLALLKIVGDGPFPALPLGRSDDLLIGEPVIAVGNPFGVGKTVTTGVVGGLKRTVKMDNGESFEDFIQTDAAINPGNSGGPLINVHGEMIGVNTAIIRGGEGIGFAIPVDRVKDIVERLIEAAVQRANLGFRPVPENGAVVVRSVEADGATKDLLTGDVVESVDGRPVRTVFDFATPIVGKNPGDRLALVVRRGAERRTLDILVPLRAEEQYVARRLGIVATELPPEARARGYTGVVVGQLLADGPAERVKMEVGDVIFAVDRYEVGDVKTLAQVLQRMRPGDSVEIRVLRRDRRMAGSVTLR